MKRFLLLHVGFEKPTPEVMGAWQKWFESMTQINVDQGGFGPGREITASGAKDLPWGRDSVTGYNVIRAASLQEAERIAHDCPFISSIRVCEIRDM